MVPDRAITASGAAIQKTKHVMPVPLPGPATKTSSEQYGGAKVLPGQLPWEPNHESAKNHE
jgi:hypothetical protein